MKVRSTGQPIGEVGGEAEHTTAPKTSTILPDLIARLEQAGEGSRELDLAVAQTLDRPWSHTDNAPTEPGGEWWPSNIKCGAYTTSIDAALALIGERLPGWSWSVRRSGFGDPADAELWNPRHAPGEANSYRASHQSGAPALALCLALLKTLQSQGETHDA